MPAFKHEGCKYYAQENVKLRQSCSCVVMCFPLTVSYGFVVKHYSIISSRHRLQIFSLIPHKTNGSLWQQDTMLHPAQSINPYHKAPSLVMEYTDVPLTDRKAEQNKSWEGWWQWCHIVRERRRGSRDCMSQKTDTNDKYGRAKRRNCQWIKDFL